jgi:hypothetical protein
MLEDEVDKVELLVRAKNLDLRALIILRWTVHQVCLVIDIELLLKFCNNGGKISLKFFGEVDAFLDDALIFYLLLHGFPP